MTAGERFVRLDRHDLTDRLFSLFSEKPYWGIPALKSTLKQPDVWLREVLKDVAEPIKEGQYTNMWALKDAWRVGVGVKGENGEGDGDGEGMMETDLEDEGEDFVGEDFEGEDEGDDADLEEVLMS